MLASITAHWQAYALPAFTVASLAVTFLAQVFAALGQAAPSWLGIASTWIAKVLHFLNGNVAAASSTTTPPPAT